MDKRMAGFRLSAQMLDDMDKLITNPPSALIDALDGKPRNRTELIDRLVKLGLRVQTSESSRNDGLPDQPAIQSENAARREPKTKRKR